VACLAPPRPRSVRGQARGSAAGLGSAFPTVREQTITARRNAERRVADELARALDNEWILLRGYNADRVLSPPTLVEHAAAGWMRCLASVR